MPYLLGVFGSAAAANLIDIIFHLDYPVTEQLISKQWLTTRLCAPTINNFTRGVKKSPFRYDQDLDTVDAGMADAALGLNSPETITFVWVVLNCRLGV